MTLYTIARFLHFVAVVSAFGAATMIHANLMRLHRATTVGEARGALAATAKVAMKMPLFALGLFLTGAWLTSQAWQWSTPFIDAGIAGLVLMLVMGGVVLRPRMMALRGALADATEGPLPGAAVSALRHPLLWSTAFGQPALALGIMFVMATKPSGPGAAVVLLVALALGAILAVPYWRSTPRPGVPETA